MEEDWTKQVEIAVRHVTMEFRRAKQEAGSLKAVSYTHLDVYKRQSSRRMGAWVDNAVMILVID